MIEVYKIEDFVITQLFRPYMSDLINEDFKSAKKSLGRTKAGCRRTF